MSRKKRKTKQQEVVDPIAEKLHAKPLSEDVLKLARVIQPGAADKYQTLAERNYEKALSDEQAQYANYDFVHSDDPEILDLLRRLGVNPDTTTSVNINIVHGQPVQVSTVGYALNSEPTIGAVWK